MPQGAPPSDLLYKILKILFSEREAELTALMPIRPFTVERAARIWKLSEAETQSILENMAERAVLIDIRQKGRQLYVLPPPMAGFFEFAMMRVRDDIDQKTLSELLWQYLNVEEDFISALFSEGETPLGRVFVHESALTEDHALHVLDYDRASHVIVRARHIGISICYCRHKMEHLEKDCDAPKDICMTFGNVASSLIRHGHARRVDAAECSALLNEAHAHNLVQFGENVQQNVSFICNCCGCCCDALQAIKKFGLLQPIHSNFIAKVDPEHCVACGACVQVCPVDALSIPPAPLQGIHSGNDTTPGTDNRQQPETAPERVHSGRPPVDCVVVDDTMCLGCGVCIRNCPAKAIQMENRPDRVITPVDTVHRVVRMAIERGKLEQLILNNGVLSNYRALAAVLGAIFRLPPVKRMLAAQLLHSRWLTTRIRKLNASDFS